MKYLTWFATMEASCALSATYYTPPVSPSPSDATKYYFSCIQKEDTKDERALIIPTSEEGVLSVEEQESLKDQTYMETNGWFPVAT